MIGDFHFLRPLLLLALVVPLMLVWLSRRSGDIRSSWKGMMDPHLLDSLIIEADRRSWFRPEWAMAAVLALAAIGAAGPTWQREAPPFVEDTASLVIVVDLSTTMDAIDISPSRIERAKLKIRDLLAARPGARTGVVGYAGTAHLVIPLTDDADLVEDYTDALATRIMPTPGKDTGAALKMADALLKAEGVSGTILLMTDGVEAAAQRKIDGLSSGLVVLGVGTTEGGLVKGPDGELLAEGGARTIAKLDLDALRTFASANGAAVATMTDDGTDVRWVAQRVRTNFAQRSAAEGDRWMDKGWWLVIPAAFLFALSFRRGWVVKVAVVLIALKAFAPSSAEAGTFADMWLTRDQQGRVAFEQGKYEAAGKTFDDPMWKGVANYRAGRFQEAYEAFALVDTPESWFNQGNALLRLGKFEEGVEAYRKALERRKDWPEATDNLALAQRLLKVQKEKEEEQPEQPNLKPDSVEFDDKGKKGKAGRMDVGEQTSEMWVKNIVVSPADLMARKFSLELQTRKP
ncbi:VWA domain-containing protein [Rhizobium sp. Root1220]|uniref:VWA domain-containing protein n=1 Tax=Rhizobium sp. Root1220 TaxID=1736432 RepID=UPI0006F9C2B3|nr:VWA domain-containing protein [Rhizobium sp. Root1220]KQV81933.1 hypothetical protein ASC90_24470 [Rhizobium sp. Root1220]